MLTSTKPSEWGRRLVRGAYDLHVHVAPDGTASSVVDATLGARGLKRRITIKLPWPPDHHYSRPFCNE